MSRYRFYLTLILVVLLAGIFTPQFAQDSPTNDKSDQEKMRRARLIGLMRTLNTQEITDYMKFGSYESWQTMLERNQEDLSRWVATYCPEVANRRFTEGPEIVPGLTLRLNVHVDGQGYDVRLQDTLESKYGFAAYSDESGVIWRAEPLQ
jgi:hypothetical protein